MEAKDTVKNPFLPAKEQAEISFKAGKETQLDEIKQAMAENKGDVKTYYDGIREVVEAVGERCYIWHDEDNKVHLCLDKELWQAKLKEWGID